ncbi:unnamed protein product [Rhizophagus irregularis]|nr:unnamed protein product [Rhizophagus irregularis]
MLISPILRWEKTRTSSAYDTIYYTQNYVRKADWKICSKINIQKEGIEIYGDFVPFCKNPSSSETESSSSSESTRLHKLEKKISEYFPDLSAEECIHVIVKSPKSPLLSLEEVLSCIPPPARYPYDTRTSISSNRVAGAWPSRITRWEEFLTETSLPVLRLTIL